MLNLRAVKILFLEPEKRRCLYCSEAYQYKNSEVRRLISRRAVSRSAGFSSALGKVSSARFETALVLTASKTLLDEPCPEDSLACRHIPTGSARARISNRSAIR